MKGREALLLSFLVAEAGCEGKRPLVAFLGDSLTSGWQLPPTQAYPAVLGRMLEERKRPVRILNAGVSAETAAQAARRLPDVLRQQPDVLVVALGINDGIRGLPLDDMERALREIVEGARGAGVRVLLVGMRIAAEPHGEEYARDFSRVYPRLAAEYRVPLVPFLLEGVAGRRELNFPDVLHPNADGQVRVAENVRPQLELLLAEMERAR